MISFIFLTSQYWLECVNSTEFSLEDSIFNACSFGVWLQTEHITGSGVPQMAHTFINTALLKDGYCILGISNQSNLPHPLLKLW